MKNDEHVGVYKNSKINILLIKFLLFLCFEIYNKIFFVMKAYSFENLDVWKESRKLVLMIYQLQKSFPSYEKYGLGDQLRRAAVSVSSNIVEGNYRFSIQEQIRFIEISFGSLMEVYCQLILAFDMNYINEHQLLECRTLIEKIRLMLIALNGQKRKLLMSRQTPNT